jgi:hypothetical protein
MFSLQVRRFTAGCSKMLTDSSREPYSRVLGSFMHHRRSVNGGIFIGSIIFFALSVWLVRS